MDSKGKDKRRRTDKDSDEATKTKKVRQKDRDQDPEMDAKTEAEVEEFFAILRRMQVAVKYFEKGNGEDWQAAVEAEVVAVVGGGCEVETEKVEIKKKEMPIMDLNALPEVDNNE